MRSMNRQFKHRAPGLVRGAQAILLAAGLVASPAVFAADDMEGGHPQQATPASMANHAGWQQELKGQTLVEEAIEGRAGLSEKVELQHHRPCAA